MRVAVAILVCLCTSLGHGAATAATPKKDMDKLNQCIQSASGNDLDAKDCYVALAQGEDARLNVNWKRLIEAVGGKGSAKGKALLAEQKAWLGYRDAACFHMALDGGTLDRLQAQICYTNLITARADEIADFADFYHDPYSPN